VIVKLAERPGRIQSLTPRAPAFGDRTRGGDAALGLTVRDLDRQTTDRLDLPRATRGVLVTAVEPLSAAFDGGICRGAILLEINRQAIDSADAYRRISGAVQPGDVLTLFVYLPDIAQRQFKTVRIEDK
jgi:S1-C subfamily serine protease